MAGAAIDAATGGSGVGGAMLGGGMGLTAGLKFGGRAAASLFVYELYYSLGKLYLQDKNNFKSLTPKRLRELL